MESHVWIGKATLGSYWSFESHVHQSSASTPICPLRSYTALMPSPPLITIFGPPLACKRSRPRNCITRRHRPIQLELDTRIRSLIRTRERHCCRRRTAAASDVDLRALHVQLRARVTGSSVKRDEFGAEEVSGGVSGSGDGGWEVGSGKWKVGSGEEKRREERGRASGIVCRSEDKKTYWPFWMHFGKVNSTLPLLLYRRVTAHVPFESIPSS